MPQKLRICAGVVTVGLSAATLLVGPAATFGLGVGSVDSSTSSVTQQVSSTTQSVTQAVQQTTTSTVNTVQDTTQSTVQTVQETAPQAPAAAPSAPAAATPAPSAPAAAAPTAAAPRVSAPAQHKVKTVAAPRTTTKRASTHSVSVKAAPRSAAGVAGAVEQAVGTTVKNVSAGHVALKTPALVTSHDRAGTRGLVPCAQVGVPAVDQLLAIVCNAGRSLILPIRLGGGDTVAPRSEANPVTVVLAGVAAEARQLVLAAHSAGIATPGAKSATGRLPLLNADGTGPGASGSPRSATPGGGYGRGGNGGGAYGGGYGYGPGYAGPYVYNWSGGKGVAHGGSGHHGLFGGPITGTRVLTLFLLADLALIAALALWRVGRRVFAPRVTTDGWHF